jgi:ABC-type dipeptide/oligopeptide/nickel transport system ATPase subunit
MKIAISGKGGVGKTTLSALLAQVYADAGRNVLAVDADPSPCLAGALGFPEEKLDKLQNPVQLVVSSPSIPAWMIFPTASALNTGMYACSKWEPWIWAVQAASARRVPC